TRRETTIDPDSSVGCQKPAVDPVLEHQGELAVRDPAAARGQAGTVTHIQDLQEPPLGAKRAKVCRWAILQGRDQIMAQNWAVPNSVYTHFCQIMTQKSDAISATEDSGVSHRAQVIIDQETSLVVGGQTGRANQRRGNKAVGGDEQIVRNSFSTG